MRWRAAIQQCMPPLRSAPGMRYRIVNRVAGRPGHCQVTRQDVNASHAIPEGAAWTDATPCISRRNDRSSDAGDSPVTGLLGSGGRTRHACG